MTTPPNALDPYKLEEAPLIISILSMSVTDILFKSYAPKDSPYGPIDLAATMFDHFGIHENTQKVDNGGRPRYLLEGEAKVIL